jgi:hypothetical protein
MVAANGRVLHYRGFPALACLCFHSRQEKKGASFKSAGVGRATFLSCGDETDPSAHDKLQPSCNISHLRSHILIEDSSPIDVPLVTVLF